jgi:hypothetical protein
MAPKVPHVHASHTAVVVIALNYIKLINVATENKYEVERLAHKLMEREY